jgi:WD40 repeat protein
VKQLGILSHSNSIDGSQSIVWQETGNQDMPFALQRGAFDAVAEPSAGGDISVLNFNSDCSFITTVTADNPKALWLWQPAHPEPHTIIMFQHPVHQVLWHPKRPDVLLILTSQKQPVVYVWHSEAKAPVPCLITIRSSGSSKYQGSWLARSMQGRHLFLLTTTKGFEVGLLEDRQGTVVFQSLEQEAVNTGYDEDEEDDSIMTPSKPSKRGLERQIGHNLRLSRFEPADAEKW